MDFKLSQATAEAPSQATFTTQPVENVRCLFMVVVVVTKTGSVISTPVEEHVQVWQQVILLFVHLRANAYQSIVSTMSPPVLPKRNVIAITVSFTGDNLDAMMNAFVIELTSVLNNNGYQDAAIQVIDISYDDKNK